MEQTAEAPALITELNDATVNIADTIGADIPVVVEETTEITITTVEETTEEAVAAVAEGGEEAAAAAKKNAVTMKKRLSGRFIKMGGVIQEMIGKACRSEKLSQNGRRKQETGAALMAGVAPTADEETAEDNKSTAEEATAEATEEAAETTENKEEATEEAQETASSAEEVVKDTASDIVDETPAPAEQTEEAKEEEQKTSEE
ncbi:hypothetical protein BDF22DRAFT_673860 [Syncephalis plumigaleata]|nr:hypothetical protein BDF22DRAFT_673860 [Syncephalis plumigaleata]